jgi:HK97 family phage major capsid protein
MSKITELRERRAKLWADTKAFLDTHQKDGILSAEDNATYERMENDVVALGHEVERLERQAALDREMAAPVNAPITAKPETGKPGDTKKGVASDAYRSAFWNVVRSRYSPDIRNALEEGVDAEGGYLVPKPTSTVCLKPSAISISCVRWRMCSAPARPRTRFPS